MSEFLPVLLQYQALYARYQIAKRARQAALQPSGSAGLHDREPHR